jgi:hypothetical protein
MVSWLDEAAVRVLGKPGGSSITWAVYRGLLLVRKRPSLHLKLR